MEETQAGEPEAEEWVPSKGRAKRIAGGKKTGKAFKAALGVVKGPGAVVVKKIGDQGVKKRAAKRAPFKGVTIKNNRYVVVDSGSRDSSLKSPHQFSGCFACNAT